MLVLQSAHELDCTQAGSVVAVFGTLQRFNTEEMVGIDRMYTAQQCCCAAARCLPRATTDVAQEVGSLQAILPVAF